MGEVCFTLSYQNDTDLILIRLIKDSSQYFFVVLNIESDVSL